MTVKNKNICLIFNDKKKKTIGSICECIIYSCIIHDWLFTNNIFVHKCLYLHVNVLH